MANQSTPVIQIKDSNVGIGTTSPGIKLDVNGPGRFVSDGASRVFYLKQDATNSGNIIQFQDQAGTNIWELVGRNNQFYIYNNGLSGFAFYINPNTSNVLIGTSTDGGYKLFVNGSIVNQTNINSTGDPGLLIDSGQRLGFDQSGVRSWNVKATGGNLAFNSGDGNGSFTFGASVTASSLVKIGGTSSQYLMADGSVSTIQTANVYTQTFFIPDTSGTAQWVKVGTWTAAQGGQVVTVEIAGHAGYNATTGQNQSVYIYMKTSNGSSVDANGFAADSSFYTQGLNAAIGAGNVIWEANAAGVSATAYTLYVLFGAYTNGSQYTVTSRGGTWANVGTLTAPSGTTSSSTILLSEFRYVANNQLLTLDGNSSVLIGTTTNNGDKFQVSGDATIGAGSGLSRLTIGSGAGYTALILKNNSAYYNFLLGSQYNVSNAFEITPSTTVGGSTFSTPVVTVLASGKVGIGTSSPSSPFTVATDVRAASLNAADLRPQSQVNLLGGGGDSLFIGQLTNSFAYIQSSYFNTTLATYPILLNPLGGNILIGTTTDNGFKLQVNGGIYVNGIGYFEGRIGTNGTISDNNTIRLLKPTGGYLIDYGNPSTGAIKITYPVGYTNTMNRVKLNVYNYTTNRSFTIYFGGYNYAPAPAWINTFAYSLNHASQDINFTVRFGYDGSKMVVYIGELSSQWAYLCAYIEEVELGFGGQIDAWKDDSWSIGFESSAFQNVTSTISNSQATNVARSGTSAYYDIGNFGVGTNNPTSPLEITNSGSAGGGTSMYISTYSAAKQWGTRTYGVDNGSGIAWWSDVQFSSTWYNAIRIGHGQNAGNPSFRSYFGTVLASDGGNVLIGTTTDSGYKLDVNGTGYFRDVTSISAANTFPLRVIRTGGPVCRASFQDPDNASNDAVWVGSQGFALCFGSAYDERGRFSSSGNLIIGSTTDAGYKLDVYGEILGRDDIRIFNTYSVGFNGADDNWRMGRNAITDSGWLTLQTLQIIVFGGESGQGFQVVNHTGTALFEINGAGGASRFTNSVGVGVNPSGTTGRIDASNDIVAYSSSDLRLKENIKPIENALDKVKALTGVEFDWKAEHKEAHGYEGHDTGVIAQEVQEVMPTAVRTNDTGYLAVRYEKLIGLLIEAVKEQQAEIDELKKLIK